MGAFTNFAAYRAASDGPIRIEQIVKTGTTGTAGRWFSAWVHTPLAGVAPTTAVVPTNSTVGSIGQADADSEQLYVVSAALSTTSGPLADGVVLLCDRLSHQAGLSGIVTTAQTTNLPTAALTRYTSGVGVFAALDIYTQIGATGTTVTASYTNQAGTAARTSTAIVFGGTASREANRSIILPKQVNDTGVRSVESVTVLATTGTAGNFGVTLFRPLMAFVLDRVSDTFNLLDGKMSGGLPEIVDGACLYWLLLSTSGSAPLQGRLDFAAV